MREKFLFKALTIAVVVMVFSACSYHGQLKPVMYSGAGQGGKKIPLKIALSERGVPMQGVDQKTGPGLSLVVDVKDGYIESVYKALGNTFESCVYAKNMTADDRVDYIVTPTFSLRNVSHEGRAIGYTYRLQMQLLFENARVPAPIITFERNETISVKSGDWICGLLGFITGFTLFVAAPIALPLAFYHSGHLVRKGLEKKITPLIDGLAGEIISSQEKLIGQPSAPASIATQRQ